MKKINAVLALAGCVAALGLSSGNVAAQGRRNFDPAQMAQYRQDRIDRITEEMNIKDDSEKKAIGDAIGKVMDAQRDMFSMRGFGFGRRNRGGGGNSADTQSSDNNSSRRQRGGFGAPSQEEEDLQKAIDDKASKEDIKAKLAAVREARKAKEAKLDTAQEDLKKLLDSRQEAVAVLNGLIK